MSNTDQAPEPSMEEILSSIRRIISDDNDSSSSDEGNLDTAPAEAAVDEAKIEELPAEETAEADPDWGLENMETGAMEDVPEPAPEPAGDDEDDDDIFELTKIVEIEEQPAKENLLEDEPVMVEPVMAEPEIELADSGADVEDDIEFVDVDTGEAEIMAMPELGPEPVFETETPAEPDVVDRLVSEGAGMAAASSFGDLATMLLSRGNSASTLEELVQEMLRPMLKSWLDENLPTLVENLVSEEIERIARRGR